jgi:hypothetical protein
MPLAAAANRGVAGHIADAVEIYREAYGAKPQPGAGEGGFDSGVTRAGDADVEVPGGEICIGAHAENLTDRKNVGKGAL